MTRRPRRLPVASTAMLVSAVLYPGGPAAASEGAVFVGACVFDVHVTFSPPLTVLPTPTSVELGTTSSLCVVNGEVVSGWFTAGLDPLLGLVGMSCEGGAAAGRGLFSTDAIDFPTTSVNVEAVRAGSAIALELNHAVYVFRGLGPFLEDPVDTASCLAGTALSTTTWTGAIAFEDPTLPSIG